MRIAQKITIDRPPADVFKLVGDPARYPSFLAGATTWKPVSAQTHGVGARFRVLMKVGAVQVGGVIEVVRWEDDVCIEWTAVQGVRQAGRWLLSPMAHGTELAIELDYDIGGGLVGKLVERIAAKTLMRNLWASLLAARRIIENEE
jgi:ribosome-associated toxin RatA of RatAB toxin-antitoxin module